MGSSQHDEGRRTHVILTGHRGGHWSRSRVLRPGCHRLVGDQDPHGISRRRAAGCWRCISDKIAGDKTIDLTKLPQMKALQPIRYKTLLSVFSSTTVARKIEKVPVATLVDSFFDLTGLDRSPGCGRDTVQGDHRQRFPESEGKQAMLKWIDQGVTNINTLRTRLNSYFTGLLDQAADSFKAHARSYVISFSLVLTLILGTDSIQLAKGPLEQCRIAQPDRRSGGDGGRAGHRHNG